MIRIVFKNGDRIYIEEFKNVDRIYIEEAEHDEKVTIVGKLESMQAIHIYECPTCGTVKSDGPFTGKCPWCGCKLEESDILL